MLMGNYPFYVKSIFYLIVAFAITHLSLSLFYGLMHGDTEAVNMFHILGFDLFWPALGTGTFNAVLGAVLVSSAWVILSLVLRWRDVRADELRTAAKPHKKKS